VAESDPRPPDVAARCSLCGHAWSAHFGGGPTAVWVTCCAAPAGGEVAGSGGAAAVAGGAELPVVAGLAGPASVCYCRRSVEEFRVEAPAGVDGTALCVTCGCVPAEDTQCRACREARQRASRDRFAAYQTQLGRSARRR
jgi:hypothetical protein